MNEPVRVPLRGALLLLLAAALLAALLPAGIALDRRVEAELRRAAMDDLGRAPMILEYAGGSRSRAAEVLGMSRITLWRRMKDFGLVGDGS